MSKGEFSLFLLNFVYLMKAIGLSILLVLGTASQALGCTAAIVGAGRSTTGRPLLWKHRDTSHVQNFMARAQGARFGFTALFNAGDSTLREAWAGVNEAGFAIINTQSYNLAPDTASIADREGLVMAAALGQCAVVADFEALLDSMSRPMGVQANFGVIDSEGDAAWFETDDHGYIRFDVNADSVAIRTNFSCSGTCGAGLGRERHAAASSLLTDKALISPEALTDTVSCSFHPHDGRKRFTDQGQYIPRRSTSASIVISADGTMWIRPGYPPTSPGTYTVTPDSIPDELCPDPADGWHAPAWREAQRRRDSVYRRNKHGQWIVDRL